MVRDEDLPKFLKGVRALMVVQVRDLCEGLVANGTPVGFLPCVCPNVIAQIVFLRKALVTGLAPVRLHPRMGAHVNLHVALLGERLWTESTFKGSFTCEERIKIYVNLMIIYVEEEKKNYGRNITSSIICLPEFSRFSISIK